MSPTTTFASAGHRARHDDQDGWGEGVPGVGGDGWVPGRAIPVPSPRVPYPSYFSIYKAEGPTHGQMKAILSTLRRFPEIGSRIDQN